MDGRNNNTKTEGWSLYADPRIFRVSAGVPYNGWIEVTLEINPEEERGIAVSGTPLQVPDETPCEASTELASLSLELKLEEIPRLIAVLNEIYRRHHEHASASLEFDPSGGEFSRREPISGGQSLTWPLFSRLEPETDLEDWKDRRALLDAYKVVADRLANDMDKLGLLRPIA